ncbi:MAG TPA: putative baseplate assembly protein [Actinophytocola sp.]|uniref:putative baseplate assembly protein n=1 Tax=Actinophytocola sp. TaxID=1872138 RepID=UPI002DDCB1E5|nr:putative baseplate assembly protein [Actinophytocola sp.]HEV2783968.1 putative baseplate assembly protein [Actinophytocola sp.]
MPLPTPNLDDRRFQDLVDEAKRRVMQRCPEWTDHNVSDPGVTLIETFAFMVDQLLYRLNRVPDLHYLRFLDLIGVQLFPPSAARCDTTFRLSAPQESTVRIPAGTQVASLRTEVEEPVVFTVERPLAIVPCTWTRLATAGSDTGQVVDRTEDVLAGRGPACFGTPPEPGNAVYVGLSEAVPGCTVLLRMECEVDGVGVDPRDPPLVWEAWDGEAWAACEVDRDTTGGFNTAGDVELLVPAGHTASIVGHERAGWLRCRTVEAEPGQPFYRASPTLHTITAATIGGTVPAVHADVVRDEVIGTSEGVPGQRFPLARRPVVAGDGPLLVEVAEESGWEEWWEVPTFARSGPDDRHVRLDRVTGEVVFGPAIRQPDGSFRYYGAVPAKSAVIRVPEYRSGGGRRGNVARGMLAVQRDPVPFVSGVTNRRPATGGVDAESIADASARGPLLLRTRDRAVTAEDYEQLTRAAAPQVARVRCVPDGEDGNGIRVLVVPAVAATGELEFATLMLDAGTRATIERSLDERRCLGARVAVEPPFYQGVTVVAQLRARRRTSPDRLQDRAIKALYDYFNPVGGGPDGDGWPFGRPVQEGEVFAALQGLSGVELVEDVRLFGANPVTGERGPAVPRLDLPPNALVFPFGHQVRVTRS